MIRWSTKIVEPDCKPDLIVNIAIQLSFFDRTAKYINYQKLYILHVLII
jgi:hypothetical protein